MLRTEDFICTACTSRLDHAFKECLSEKCTCKCVNQIKNSTNKPVCTCGYLKQLENPGKHSKFKYDEQCGCARTSNFLPPWLSDLPWSFIRGQKKGR